MLKKKIHALPFSITVKMMTEFKISSLPSETISSHVIKTFPWLWRVANGVMAIFLALAAYVQVGIFVIFCSGIYKI